MLGIKCFPATARLHLPRLDKRADCLVPRWLVLNCLGFAGMNVQVCIMEGMGAGGRVDVETREGSKGLV